MQGEIFETMNKFSQTALENYKKIGENTLKATEKIWQEQTELADALVEVSARSAEKATSAKDFQAMAANQAEWMQECSKAVWDSAKSWAEIMAESAKFYNGVFETGLKNVNNNFAGKTAAKGRKSA